MIQQIKQNALNNQRDRQRLSSLRPKSQCSLNKGVDYSAKQIYPTFRLAAYKRGKWVLCNPKESPCNPENNELKNRTTEKAYGVKYN